jgi:hypothetical protein
MSKSKCLRGFAVCPLVTGGAKGGASGRGPAKARTSEQARAAVAARWHKVRAMRQMLAANVASRKPITATAAGRLMIRGIKEGRA